MPATRSNSKNTVRSGNSRTARAVLCVTAFVLTGLVVNTAKTRQATPPTDGRTTTASATVCQRFPADGFTGLALPNEADITRRIAEPGNLRRALSEDFSGSVTSDLIGRVHENLRISLDQGLSPDRLQVSIGYLDEDPHRAAQVVNALARQYASDQNEVLAAMARKSCRDASDASEAASREFFEAKARFYQFLELHFNEHGERAGRTQISLTSQTSYSPEPAISQSDTRAGMVENPDWSELSRRVSNLVRKRDEFLVNKTSLHPEVRAIENQILDFQKRLDEVPRYLPDPNWIQPKIEPRPGAESAQPSQGSPRVPEATIQEHEAAVRDFYMYKAAVDNAAEAYERLSLAERLTWQKQSSPSTMELQLAAVEEKTQAPRQSSGLPLVALTAALAMAAGVGMISSGLGHDPTLDTADQVRAKLPIPVVGIIPAANRASATAGRRQRRPLGGFGMIGYGVVLVFICMLILLSAFA